MYRSVIDLEMMIFKHAATDKLLRAMNKAAQENNDKLIIKYLLQKIKKQTFIKMKSKNFIRFAVLTAIIIVSTSCLYFNVVGIVGKGSIIAQNVAETKFSAIEVASSANVEISKGEAFNVILSDYENLLDYWDVKVVNNTLIIQTKPFTSLVNTRAKVTIVMPDELYQASVTGSGNIALNSQFYNFEKASITGSGSINGNINTVYSKLNLTISGSGSILIKGRADELKAKTTGSGKMRLSELTVQDAECTVSGSGNMYLNVEKTLKATISGSGDIFYTGRPVIDSYGSGSGRLIHN
jgi:hypothetical protein